MKSLSLVSLSVAALFALLFLPVTAQEGGVVNTTITPKLIAISVSPSELDYGSLEPGQSYQRPNPTYFQVFNQGSVNIDLQIRGEDTQDWTLASMPGQDAYVHRFTIRSDLDDQRPLTKLSQSLAADLFHAAPGRTAGNIDVFLTLDMPTSVTSAMPQTAKIIVTAVESSN